MKQNHGHNENDKNSGWENAFSHRLFFRFPRMLCIRLAAFRRRPVVAGASGASNSQYCNLHLSKGLCVFLGEKTTIPQALRASSLYSEGDGKEGVILIRKSETVNLSWLVISCSA